MYEIRWHGRGGQGSFTGAKLLGAAAALHDHRYAQAFPSFGPERRGAPVLGFNRISDTPIHLRSEVDRCDAILLLDETLWEERFLEDLKPGALVLMNSPRIFENPSIFSLDATRLALEILGKPIANTAMLGFLAAKAPHMISSEACLEALATTMKPAHAKTNAALFEAAFRAGKE